MANTTLVSPISPGLAIKTNMEPCDSFPTYVDPFDSSDDAFAYSDVSTMASATPSPTSSLNKKLVEKLRDDPSRHASPQPTSVSHGSAKVNGNGYRVLRSATVGYIAPAFVGKSDQMKEGEQSNLPGFSRSNTDLATHSQGPDSEEWVDSRGPSGGANRVVLQRIGH